MSLVAYEAGSSDEGSESEDSDSGTVPVIGECSILIKFSFVFMKFSIFSVSKPKQKSPSPVPLEDQPLTLKFNLPQPNQLNVVGVEEEEDEFLKKKAVPSIDLVKPAPKKGPVRIMLPSLSSFKDDEPASGSGMIGAMQKTKISGGLLSMLPKPKSEMIFTSTKNPDELKKQNPFIPYSITNKAKAKGDAKPTKKSQKSGNIGLIANYSDSEEDEAEGDDFFSLNSEEKLPEISESEINAMVAKKVAKLAANAAKYDAPTEVPLEEPEEINPTTFDTQRVSQIDSETLQQLCGTGAKRKRQENINIVDISHDQVMPSRDDWMRTALTQSTEYQPRGSLVDDELTPGSKRKHQITYLAHQAKANEQELQAMWAANRQSRRQTQSKYGF